MLYLDTYWRGMGFNSIGVLESVSSLLWWKCIGFESSYCYIGTGVDVSLADVPPPCRKEKEEEEWTQMQTGCWYVDRIFMPAPAVSRRRHSVFELSARASVHWWSYSESLLTRYRINHLWEFHQIHNFGAVGEKMNQLYFEVKGQGHARPNARFRWRHTVQRFTIEHLLVLQRHSSLRAIAVVVFISDCTECDNFHASSTSRFIISVF